MNPECNLLAWLERHTNTIELETYQVIPLSLGYVLGPTLPQLELNWISWPPSVGSPWDQGSSAAAGEKAKLPSESQGQKPDTQVQFPATSSMLVQNQFF